MSRKQINRFEGYDDRYLVEIELFLRGQLSKANRKEVMK